MLCQEIKVTFESSHHSGIISVCGPLDIGVSAAQLWQRISQTLPKQWHSLQSISNNGTGVFKQVRSSRTLHCIWVCLVCLAKVTHLQEPAVLPESLNQQPKLPQVMQAHKCFGESLQKPAAAHTAGDTLAECAFMLRNTLPLSFFRPLVRSEAFP